MEKQKFSINITTFFQNLKTFFNSFMYGPNDFSDVVYKTCVILIPTCTVTELIGGTIILVAASEHTVSMDDTLVGCSIVHLAST